MQDSRPGLPDTGEVVSREGFDRLLAWAAEQGAAWVSLDPGGTIWSEMGGQPRPLALGIVGRQAHRAILENLCGQGASHKLSFGQSIDLTHRVVLGSESQRFRVMADAAEAPDGGSGFTIHAVPIPAGIPDAAAFGLEAALSDGLCLSPGIILVSGLAMSGRSTLAAVLLNTLSQQGAGALSIHTCEDQIGHLFSTIAHPGVGVAQTQVGGRGPSMAAAIKAATDDGANILAVDGAMDAAAWRSALNAVAAGCLVVVLASAVGVAETVQRVMSSFEEEGRTRGIMGFAGALRAIVSQELLQGADGRLVACREFLLVGPDEREVLFGRRMSEFVPVTRQLVKERGQTMGAAIRRVMATGAISSLTGNAALARRIGGLR